MGVLDPKVDKARTFELLEKRGVVRAEVPFHGGHDEGWFDTITLTLANGSEVKLEHWYCGGYGWSSEAQGYVPGSTPANEDEELGELLGGPVDQRFGAWDSVPSTSGSCLWNVVTKEVTLFYEQDESVEHTVPV